MAITTWAPNTGAIPKPLPGHIMLAPVCLRCGEKTFTWTSAEENDIPQRRIQCCTCGHEQDRNNFLHMLQALAPGEEPAILPNPNKGARWWYVSVPQRGTTRS
jgi:hypothetical protein